MPWIAVDVQALIEDLFADSGLPTRRRQRTATFFGAASVEIEREEAQQICHRLRFKNRRIYSGFHYAGTAPAGSFEDRFARDTSSIKLSNIKMVAEKIARAAAVLRPGRGRQA